MGCRSNCQRTEREPPARGNWPPTSKALALLPGGTGPFPAALFHCHRSTRMAPEQVGMRPCMERLRATPHWTSGSSVHVRQMRVNTSTKSVLWFRKSL